ncbi:MAG TPA: hypothetical protein DF613_15870 [Lachnospiraceae bacterium]|nr:hypothetical protein [Lachnospiraceae bacterium]
MKNWKEAFSPATLNMGRELYKNGSVTNLEQTDKGYEAFVQDRTGYTVKIGMKGGVVKSMVCGCPVASGKGNCKHIAAVIFAVQQKLREERKARPAEVKEQTDGYSYFQMDELQKKLGLTAADLRKAEKLVDGGLIRLDSADLGYTEYEDAMICIVRGTFLKKNVHYTVSFNVTADQVLSKYCDVAGCKCGSYSWYGMTEKTCEHLAALFLLFRKYAAQNRLGDATDKAGIMIIRSFQDKRAVGVVARNESCERPLLVRPRVVQKEDGFWLSFKVGEEGGRLYLIKSMEEFTELVANGGNGHYGTTAVFNHSLENFSEDSRKYISFIQEIVSDEQEFIRRYVDNYGGYRGKNGVGQQIQLSGRRLDIFYEFCAGGDAEYENRTVKPVRKGGLTCAEGNPRLELTIRKYENTATHIFEGIKVSGEIPVLLRGQQHRYYLENMCLYRLEREFVEHVEPLLSGARYNTLSFKVGRQKLAAFYYTILPTLRDYVEIREEDAGVVEQYLQPDVRFVFYLDAVDQDAVCRAVAVYGEEQVPLADQKSVLRAEAFRDQYRESEARYTVRKFFPELDEEHQEYHCGKDEDAVYRVLSEGVQALMAMGEVQSTDRFKRLNVSRRTKVTVGVSLESGLLNLDISSEDISQEELLEVLASYRMKRRFHRLKNGDFLSLEDDNLAMLSEMMEALHMTPKEFVKGKMQIPAYRALYLDRMLEENDHVYSNRDSRFKKLIKDFKVVSDADFEEPPTLQKVLRKYQKTGFRWIRTLETCHFGGILADDMGLGKTLQMITALLSLKLENNLKTALVVCPASLVYNWGEEFSRFAPELSVCLVTGTQEERREKLADYQSYDVLVTSYDLLKRDIVSYEDIRFGYEVIDEAQYIKNHTTAAAKAVKLVHSDTRFALTGTPIENRLSELWSIFDYLMPGFLYRYETFKKEFETPIVRSNDEKAAERLRKMTGPFIMRRLKGDVLKDLPDKLEEIRYARFEAQQQRLYDAQVVHMRKTLAEQDPEEFQKNKLEILRELTRLRQICCDPSLCFEDYKGGSAKLATCLDLVESAVEGGHKILLFSQFTTMLERIRQAFADRGITYYEITGSTPKEKRLSLVRQFNKDQVQVFLISLKAGGTGLNLTGADVVIHYDPWWNVAVQNQATDRAHRIGQTKVVSVFKLIMKNTIEEKICKLQESKQNLADQILSGDAASIGSMSREELLELLM